MTKRLKIILMCIVAFFLLVGVELGMNNCGSGINLVAYPKDLQTEACMKGRDIIFGWNKSKCERALWVGQCTGPEINLYFRPLTWLYEIKNLLK